MLEICAYLKCVIIKIILSKNLNIYLTLILWHLNFYNKFLNHRGYCFLYYGLVCEFNLVKLILKFSFIL